MYELLLSLGKCVVAYLVGAIPSGYLLARYVKGIDIRDHGSKNIGATNVTRVLGKKLGVVTLLLDAGKSFLVMKLLYRSGNSLEALIVPMSILLGNCYSIFLHGKGGKGVSTTFGIYLAISPILFGVGFAVYIFWVLVTRISAVGSLASAMVWPIVSYLWFPEFLWTSVILSCLIIIRHHKNIAKLAVFKHHFS